MRSSVGSREGQQARGSALVRRAIYRYLVWGSAIAFGTIHLLNYDELTGPIDLILVLPQTLGGLVLAYTRTRLGLPLRWRSTARSMARWCASGF